MSAVVLSTMLLLAFLLAIFLGSGYGRSCANSQHTIWCRTSEIGRQAHPKPSKDLVNYFLRCGYIRPSNFQRCVDMAKEAMKTDSEDTPKQVSLKVF